MATKIEKIKTALSLLPHTSSKDVVGNNSFAYELNGKYNIGYYPKNSGSFRYIFKRIASITLDEAGNKTALTEAIESVFGLKFS